MYPLCTPEPGPAPKAVLLFQGCSSLVFASPPSLVSNSSSLPFGTQGRSQKLGSIPYKQEMGQKGFQAQEAQALLGFRGTLFNPLHWCFPLLQETLRLKRVCLSPFRVENVCLEGLTSDQLDSSHSPFQQAKKRSKPS